MPASSQMFIRSIGTRFGGLPLKGTRTHIMLLPVGLAVVGRSWAVLIANVRLGATFGDQITAFGADGLDMLAVRDMLYASSSSEQTGCYFCYDARAFSRCNPSTQSLRRGLKNSKLKLEKQTGDRQIMNE